MGRRRLENPGYSTLASRRSRARLTESELNITRLKNRCRRYGITVHDVIEQHRAQGGRCAGCPRPIDIYKAHDCDIDHDHDTGVVRGLLCRACNLALPAIEADLRDGADPLTRAVRLAAYVKGGGVFRSAQLTLEAQA